jgi:hypothetical protein
MALVGSPSSVLSKGIGSWGSVHLMITRGLGVAEYIPPTPIYAVTYQVKLQRHQQYPVRIRRHQTYQSGV